jgi:hypothetical protein
MGRVSLSRPAGALCIAALMGAFSIGSAPPDRAGDHAAGTGQTTVENGGAYRFELAAASDADGSNPQGYLQLHTQGPHPDFIQADVTCLVVSGSLAGVGARVVRATDGSLVGQGLQFTVLDAGPPEKGTSADTASPVSVVGEPPNPDQCPFEITGPQERVLVEVKDAAPLSA